MKINEITEAPVSGIKQKAQAFGARALNKLGAKDTARNLAGKADLGLTANNLFRDFSEYLGTQGKSLNQATGRDLKSFLDDLNVDTTGIPNGPINRDRLNRIVMQKARQAMQGKGGKKSSTPSATPQFKSSRSKKNKLKLPADVVASVSKLSKKQKLALAQALQTKYGS